MENLSLEKNSDKIFSSQEIVFNLVTLYYLNHRSICNFGATSKDNDCLMINLAEIRKKILGNIPERAQLQSNTWYQGAWHAYGSFYNCVYVRSYAEKKVQAQSYTLLSPLKRVSISDTYNVNTGNFIDPLPCKNVPYYDKDICYFYGVRKRNLPYKDRQGNLRVYKSISICKFIFKGLALECRISISADKSWGLKQFLDHPLFLEAILNSTVISNKEKVYINVHGKQKKRAYWDYALEGITIPENYKKYIKNTNSTRQTAWWDILAPDLKSAIDMRYQEQLKQT
jgi:hypothetical protein